jgi:hypothetical protein
LGEEAKAKGLVDYSMPKGAIDEFIFNKLIPNSNYEALLEKKKAEKDKIKKPIDEFRHEELT